MRSRFLVLLVSAPLIFFLNGCPTIAPYSQKSYENATTIKAEALNLLSKASNEDYDANKSKVDALKLDVEKAYEYANGIPKNERISQMWALLMNENRKGTLFEVLDLWKEMHKLDPVFLYGIPEKNIPGIKDQIAREFDQIIGLESGKNR